MKATHALKSGGLAGAACVACCAAPIVAALGMTAGIAALVGVFVGIMAAVAVVLFGAAFIGVRRRSRRQSAAISSPSSPEPVAVDAPVRR